MQLQLRHSGNYICFLLPTVSSPAQATSAERVIQHHQQQQPQTPQPPSSTYPPGEDTRLRYSRRQSGSSQSVADHSIPSSSRREATSSRVSDSSVYGTGRDSVMQSRHGSGVLGAGGVGVSEPRVVLENILPDSSRRLSHAAPQESGSHNKKKPSGPVVMLEMLDAAVSDFSSSVRSKNMCGGFAPVFCCCFSFFFFIYLDLFGNKNFFHHIGAWVFSPVLLHKTHRWFWFAIWPRVCLFR